MIETSIISEFVYIAGAFAGFGIVLAYIVDYGRLALETVRAIIKSIV